MPDQRIVVEHRGCLSGCGNGCGGWIALMFVIGGPAYLWEHANGSGRVALVAVPLALIIGGVWVTSSVRTANARKNAQAAELARRQPFHDFEAAEWAKADRLAREQEQAPTVGVPEATTEVAATPPPPPPPPTLPAAGWYADPLNAGQVRRWDGTKWTDDAKPVS